MRCRADAVPVRVAPSDEAEQVTQALLREPLAVEALRNRWARVRTVSGARGWLREGALEEGRGVLPPPLPGRPVDLALRFLGAPYEWGGLSAAGIDCSGLVHLAHRLAGCLVPRDSWQQEHFGEAVEEGRAELVTYGSGGRADHIAFWLGEARILHATARSDLGVVEEPETPELARNRRSFLSFQYLVRG